MFGPFDDIFDTNKDGVMDDDEKAAEIAFINDTVRKEAERDDNVDPFAEDDTDDNDIKYKDSDRYDDDDDTGEDF